MLILGAHMSIAGGFAQAAQKTGKDFGCAALQIFTKSPRGGVPKPVDPQDAASFKAHCIEHKINYVIAHSSYLLNFAKSIKSLPWMRDNIMLDFTRLHALGGLGVVVHIGKALETERSIGIKNVIENAKQIVEETEELGMEYILENTAGQGSEIGFRLEELGEVWKGLKGFSPRLKSCLDTAHVWGAGYDIGTKTGAQKFLKEYDQIIGLKTLSCFHFNDSKKECGSRLDRHENIGKGFVGIEGLTEMARFAVENEVPMILETPDGERTARARSQEKTGSRGPQSERGERTKQEGSTHFDDVKVVRKMMRQS
jgi:deoxyribonuclease-4